jgi:spore coat polysaccharide biosynthesis predicted glycosyltransferase SpsG
MAEADIAIAAAGSTCWEMCFMGLPALILDIAENQTAEAMELHRRGYAKYLGSGSTLGPQKLAAELTELLGSQKVRSEISQRCRKLVDGRGAERVVAAMLERGSQSIASVVHEGVRA